MIPLLICGGVVILVVVFGVVLPLALSKSAGFMDDLMGLE